MRTYRQMEAWLAYQDRHPSAKIREGGMCQWMARNAVGAAPFGRRAIDAWRGVPRSWRHAGAPPPGALCYWSGGDAGHAAVAVEGHKIWSTDIRHYGQIDKVPYTLIHEKWNYRYLGYLVITPSGKCPTLLPVRRQAVVHVSRVQPNKRGVEVLLVQKALASEPQIHLSYASEKGTFGHKTVAGYERWQRHLGFTGGDADGIPGITSLRELGKRHGFLGAP